MTTGSNAYPPNDGSNTAYQLYLNAERVVISTGIFPTGVSGQTVNVLITYEQ